ncbi:MAG: putative drug exporter of the superfamily, partial [Mycobacterium sp.]|nr:putative drug exporter of the superfamily [Mycobacterium sp.]
MSEPISEPTTDAIPTSRYVGRSFIPRSIRKLAVVVILVWIAVIALLNVVVPQLETVGQMR